MSKGKVVILGGGPCGVAAARELGLGGYQVTLIESNEKLGGLGSHKSINGNSYEFGTHVFHTDNKNLLQIVREEMGSELIELERGSNIQIKFRGRYFNYPLKGINLISNLPPHVALLAGASLLKSMILYDVILRRTPQNTEEYLIQKFGQILYQSFFRDYSEKVWGAPCSKLDAEFGAQRIPRSDIFSFLKSIVEKFGLSKLLDPHPLSESVIGNIFYCAQGIGQVYEKMGCGIVNRGNTVMLKSRLKRLIVEQGKIKAAVIEQEGKTLEVSADYFINTIPLPELIKSLDDHAPIEVRDAAANLNYRAIALVGMLVDKPQVRSAYFTYYQDYTFNRLSEPSNHGLKVNRDGHSILLAETVCQYNDEAYRGESGFTKKVVADLLKEGLVTKNQIVEVNPYSWRYAYPIYSIGYRNHLNKIGGYIKSISNLHSTGRQGRFNYVNMHVAVQMGIDSRSHVDGFFSKINQ